MNGKTALALIFGLAAVAALAIKIAVRMGGEPLPIISELPPFELTDNSGRRFTLNNLIRSATVVDFIFTRCQGPCPMMAAEMGKLQRAFVAQEGLRFLSISVDPAYDTPQVLTEYGAAVGADPGRWTFLTGSAESIVQLSEQGFKLAASTWPVEHSTRFVLVDRRGRIRGYYDSADSEAMTGLAEDIGRLLRHWED